MVILSVDVSTKIFKPFEDSNSDESFEEYFNRNLNPDLSVPGFLEELDRLIQACRNQPISIGYNGDEAELANLRLLKAYLQL